MFREELRKDALYRNQKIKLGIDGATFVAGRMTFEPNTRLKDPRGVGFYDDLHTHDGTNLFLVSNNPNHYITREDLNKYVGYWHNTVDTDEVPDSITHTRSMSVEDIIKEYGDMVSEEALETLKSIKADYEKRADEMLAESDIDHREMFVDGLLFGACSHHFDVPHIPREAKIISYASSLGSDKKVTPKSFMDFEKQRILRQLEEDAAKWFIATSPANRYSKSNVVHQPWGSYTPTKDGFFIPPERKPYEPEYIQASRRHKRCTIPAHLLDHTWCNANKSITDYQELKNAQNKYNIIMNEICNKVETEKLEAVVEYLSEVIRKNLSSKKIAKVFRKIRKIYG